jgi:Skp family chaperone for outer membrane proteins
MKSNHLILLLCLGIVGTTSANTNTNAIASERPPGQRIQQDISKWDKNQDGLLSGDEMDAFRKDKLRERQAQAEARAKAAAVTRSLEEAARHTRLVPPSVLPRYDLNTNGLMDMAEWQAYRQDIERRTAEKRQAHLATNAPVPASASFTNPPAGR